MNDDLIKQFCSKLTNEDMKFIYDRLNQRLQGDVSSALLIIENKYPDLDRYLSSATNHVDFYRMIDNIQKTIELLYVRPVNNR